VYGVDPLLAGELSRTLSTLNLLAIALFQENTPFAFQVGRPLLVCADVSRTRCSLTDFTQAAWRLYRLPDDADRRLSYETYRGAHDWLRSLAEFFGVPVSTTPGCVLSLAAGTRLR